MLRSFLRLCGDERGQILRFVKSTQETGHGVREWYDQISSVGWAPVGARTSRSISPRTDRSVNCGVLERVMDVRRESSPEVV